MQRLIDSVQHNCDIADARHGSDYGMCTYLLKMRELYRWTQGLPLGASLNSGAVGDWLTAREQHLESLEAADFAELEVDGQRYDPFDAEPVNDAIAPLGLVYSAGLVNGARPSFFLGELEGAEVADNGFRLRISGRELARCLNSPPAMTQGATIFLRRESLRRYLWEKYESWLWSRPDNAMARALAHYPFEQALDDIGFIDARRSQKLMRRLRRLFHRAAPNPEEVNILRGILSAAQGRKSMRPPAG